LLHRGAHTPPQALLDSFSTPRQHANESVFAMTRLIIFGIVISALLMTGTAPGQDRCTFFRLVADGSAPHIATVNADGTIGWPNFAGDISGRIQRATGLAGESNWTDYVEYAGARTSFIVRVHASQPPAGMVLVPAGVFQRGDSLGDGGNNELPVRAIYTDAFFTDPFETTKELWDSVYQWALSHGYEFMSAGSGKDTNHPVYEIEWADMLKWCNARSEMEELIPCYYTNDALTAVYRSGNPWDSVAYNMKVNWTADGYRLPTEAEWEKAARGGARHGRFPWTGSDAIRHERANYASWWYQGVPNFPYDANPVEGYHPLYDEGTSPVGSFDPNGYGLYDMAGNVREWCWDWYDETYYQTSPTNNPCGPTGGMIRVYRGGAYYSSAHECRTANRFYSYGPHQPIGFRTVRRAP
jgi:formylglycine-generating enzyme required for sulfatase activity